VLRLRRWLITKSGTRNFFNADADADAGAKSDGDFFIDSDRLDSGMRQADGNSKPFSYNGLVAQDTEQGEQLKKFYQKVQQSCCET
jgi:hypothetical protein